MNKIVLVVSLFALALSGVNTVLLLQMGGRMKAIGEKIEPVARQIEEIQPMLRGIGDRPPPPDGAARPEGPQPPDGTPRPDRPPFPPKEPSDKGGFPRRPSPPGEGPGPSPK